MPTSLMEHASDLGELVNSVVRLRDPMGVLSVTAGIEPGTVNGAGPGWKIALQNDLRALGADGSLGRILERRIEEVGLDEFLTPTAPGRGRALYVALESGELTDVILRPPLPTSAHLGPVAHVLPLLSVLEAGRPAGLLVASRDAIVIREVELGVVRDVDVIELEPWIGDWWPEMKGPARANPERGQEMVSQRDRYQRRVSVAYQHTFDEAAESIRSLARARTWTRAVLAGDSRRTGVLDTALRGGGMATATIDANLEGVRTRDAVERLEKALRDLVRRQVLDQVRLAVRGDDDPSTRSCGLADVLTPLSEGRVAELLIERERAFPGIIGADESLSATDQPNAGADLTDVIVAQALMTGAAVTPVDRGSSEALSDCGGIAARLRW